MDGLPIDEDPPAYILTIKPPKLHIYTRYSEAKIIENSEAIKAEWTEFRMVHNHAESNMPVPPLTNSILTSIIVREIGYQIRGRPGREDSKRFESHMRNYLFLKRPTGSEVYDQLFQEMIPHLEDLRSQENPDLTQLQILWEENHPGEKFFPEKEAA